MYATETVPISDGMRAELERLARGPGSRWPLMARYAVKTGTYVGLGMCAFIVLGYALAQSIEYLFPASAFCRQIGTLASKLPAALPVTLIAAACAAWFSRFEWRHRTAMAKIAQRDLAAGTCDQITFELTSRHVLAFVDDGALLLVPAAGGKTFVVATGENDPRTSTLGKAQGETCGSHWCWLSARETDLVSDLVIGGDQVALMEGFWLDGTALWDKLEDLHSDGELLDIPFEEIEHLAREPAQTDAKAAIQPANTTPATA